MIFCLYNSLDIHIHTYVGMRDLLDIISSHAENKHPKRKQAIMSDKQANVTNNFMVKLKQEIIQNVQHALIIDFGIINNICCSVEKSFDDEIL